MVAPPLEFDNSRVIASITNLADYIFFAVGFKCIVAILYFVVVVM